MRPQPLAIGASAAIVLLVTTTSLSPIMFADARGNGDVVGTGPRSPVVSAEQYPCDAVPGSANTGPDRGGSIQGQVFQVFDDARQPLGGVTVGVQKLGFASGTTRSVKYERTAITNVKGYYRIKDLPAGEYYVSAVMNTAESFADDPRDRSPKPERTGFGLTFYPGTTSFADAHRVVVYPGLDVGEIDIPVERKRLARLSGRMIGTRQELMDGAYVGVIPAASAGRAGLSGFMGISRVTPDGEFMVDSVPPGEYLLQGRSVPLAAVQEIARTGSSAPLTANVDGEFGSLSVTVGGTDVANLQLILRQGGRVRGSVEMDGQPLQPEQRRFGIRAEPTSADAFSAGNSDSAIRNDGAFEIRGLAGVFVLRLSGDIRGARLVRVEMEGQDVTDTGGAVNPGEEVSGVKVIVTSRPSGVSGHIARGTALLSPCWVIVFSAESQRWSWAASRYVAAARVGPRGAFQIEGLPPGKYLAAVVTGIEEGAWLDPEYLGTLVRQAGGFQIKEGDRKTLDFSAASK